MRHMDSAILGPFRECMRVQISLTELGDMSYRFVSAVVKEGKDARHLLLRAEVGMDGRSAGPRAWVLPGWCSGPQCKNNGDVCWICSRIANGTKLKTCSGMHWLNSRTQEDEDVEMNVAFDLWE